jgi:hypothetical protein
VLVEVEEIEEDETDENKLDIKWLLHWWYFIR